MRKFVVATAIGISCLFIGNRAFACDCNGWGLANELRGGSGTIPVNAEGIGWAFAQFSRFEETELRDFVTVLDLDSNSEVDFDLLGQEDLFYLIGPANWAVGKRYRVSVEIPFIEMWFDPDQYEQEKFETVDVVVSPAFEPDAFQISHGTPDYRVATAPWLCGGLDSFVTATVEPHFSPIPDMRLLDLTVFRNGTPIDFLDDGNVCGHGLPPGGFEGFPLVPSAYAVCGEEQDIFSERYAEGEVEVHLRARFPGTDVMWESERIMVTLECDPEDTAESEPETSGCSFAALGPSKLSTIWLTFVALVLARRRFPKSN